MLVLLLCLFNLQILYVRQRMWSHAPSFNIKDFSSCDSQDHTENSHRIATRQSTDACAQFHTWNWLYPQGWRIPIWTCQNPRISNHTPITWTVKTRGLYVDCMKNMGPDQMNDICKNYHPSFCPDHVIRFVHSSHQVHQFPGLRQQGGTSSCALHVSLTPWV